LVFGSSLEAGLTNFLSSSQALDLFYNRSKSLSCLPVSIILVAPNAAMFLVQGTGFIAPRAPKSNPQMKQNPWFERFKVLGQITNVPLGQNLEG
jgi:hypothetical protein